MVLIIPYFRSLHNLFYRVINFSDSVSYGFSQSITELTNASINLTKVDALLSIIMTTASSIDTFYIYNDIYTFDTFANSMSNALNTVKQNTNDDILISAIDKINLYMTNQTESQKGAYTEAFKNFGMGMTYEAIDFAIGMAGPVGVAISGSLALGNLAGISSSATNAMKTCCEAGIADALALSLTQKMNSYPYFTSTNIPGKWWALYDNTRDGKTEHNDVYNQYYYLFYARVNALEAFSGIGNPIEWLNLNYHTAARTWEETNRNLLDMSMLKNARLFINSMSLS
jgi:hypothetical protein